MAPSLNAVGIVASDMKHSLDFYRLLGFDVPDTPDQGHVDVSLPNGFRLMLDSEATMRQISADWTGQSGNRCALAFE